MNRLANPLAESAKSGALGKMHKFYAWLSQHWVAGAIFIALALLAVLPLTVGNWSRPFGLLFLFLPAYMLHQVEEHWDDRFRLFVNRTLFKGRDALTTESVLWTNLPGVWGVGLIALYAAYFSAPGWGLATSYLLVINALLHCVGGVRARSYNPGLWTAVFLFLPLGLASLILVPASFAQHLLGFGVALAIHLAIVAHVLKRARRLELLEKQA